MVESVGEGVARLKRGDRVYAGGGFTTAGGHFNPDSKKHGLDNPDGAHAGDMKNFTVKASGTAKVTVTDERVTMGTDNHSIFTNGGTAPKP